MEKKRSILMVDDNNAYRNKLVEDLIKTGAEVEGVASGEEAVQLVENNPRRFQFAVIDHFLKPPTDGIQTTRRLVAVDRGLLVLVFTNLVFDEEDKARYRYDALSAGAHRYIETISAEKAPMEIGEFLGEMEQVARISDWIKGFYDNRANVPSLLTQLDIGVDIIDRSHKVWFMNDAMQRITGFESRDVPDMPCSFWHGYRFVPCMGCLVAQTFNDGEPRNRFFLSPFPYREQGRLFYLNVWTQALCDSSGERLVGSDGRPLTVMESVQDLSQTGEVRDMSLEQRLGIIASSLRACPIDGFLPRSCFRRVKIYHRMRGSQDQFGLMATAGFESALTIGKPIDLRKMKYFALAEERMRKTEIGCFFHEPGRKDLADISVQAEQFILWPILRESETVAMIEVSGGNCSEERILEIEPYAREVFAALEDDRKRDQAVIRFSIEIDLGRIENELNTVASAREALQCLVKAGCELTESYLGVLRYRNNEEAFLLPLGVNEYGAYEAVAEPQYPLSHGHSWSVRTINSGQRQLTSDINVIKERQKSLTEEAREALKEVRSLCFEPLFFDKQCVGSLGLHSKYPDNYTERKRMLLEEIADRLSYALHDYLVEKRVQERLEKGGVVAKGPPASESGEDLAGAAKIFLSHKGSDKPRVRKFQGILKSLGFEPWLDEEDAEGHLEKSLLEGMKESCAAVFFITPRFKDEGYLETEIEYAIQEERKRKDRFKIIPLVFEEDGKKGKVPDLLNRFVQKCPKTDMEVLEYIIRLLPIQVGKTVWKGK